MDLQLVILECLPAETQQDTAFIKACAENHIEEVERMLQWPQNPNATEEQGGYTALHAASQEGMVQSVCLLLEARADVGLTTRGWALACFCEKPAVQMFKQLLYIITASMIETLAPLAICFGHRGQLTVWKYGMEHKHITCLYRFFLYTNRPCVS